MEALMSLVQRNNKVFRRDKTQVFFSTIGDYRHCALRRIPPKNASRCH